MQFNYAVALASILWVKWKTILSKLVECSLKEYYPTEHNEIWARTHNFVQLLLSDHLDTITTVWDAFIVIWTKYCM